MNKRIFIFLTGFLFITTSIHSQTFVNGGIYSNTTWTTSGSPYIVTGALTLFPGNTLTIEPGVKVEFEDSVLFEVRGNLIALGTHDDSITFCAYQNPANDAWTGIKINHELGGAGTFYFCIFKNAKSGISNFIGPDPHMVFKRCYFENNFIGISGWGGDYDVSIDSCLFNKNVRTITKADIRITNSVFTYNEYGLYDVERIQVNNCIFCGNTVGIRGDYGVMNNVVITKSRVGMESGDFSNLTINTGNIITDNDTGVVYSPFFPGGSGIVGTGNIICQNNYYDIVYKNAGNMTATNNCWCETDSLIISQKIYDGYDNPAYGLLILSPVVDCNSSVIPDTSYCSPQVGITEQNRKDPEVKIYPNPFNDFCIIEMKGISKGSFIKIFNSTGTQVETHQIIESTIRIDRKDKKKGLYFYTINTDCDSIIKGKLIIL